MSEHINENLKTSIYDKYDVVIVGGGPAGCGAGITAARQGLRTLVIEKQNCLGGAWTGAYINPFFDFENKKGLVGEIVGELQSEKHWGGFWNMSFNYEYLKSKLEEKMLAAGAEILYCTQFSRTLVEDNRVVGVVAENIEGRFAVLADTVIDCTGDGNVAADAGCEFLLGENGDYKECQAMTLMFLVGNIPHRYRKGLMIYKKFQRVYDKAGKKIPFTVPYLIPIPHSRFGVVQFTHMYEHNPLSAADLTRANIEGRRQMLDVYGFLKKYDRSLRRLDLISSAPVLGVRESRRIVGEHTVTVDDILNGTQFPDAVCKVAFNVDIHTKSNNGQKCFKVKPYQIPLRALIPKGFDGLLVAGRCISGEREAMASYRVTGNCMQMGEFAARALAKAKSEGTDIRNVKLEFSELL